MCGSPGHPIYGSSEVGRYFRTELLTGGVCVNTQCRYYLPVAESLPRKGLPAGKTTSPAASPACSGPGTRMDGNRGVCTLCLPPEPLPLSPGAPARAEPRASHTSIRNRSQPTGQLSLLYRWYLIFRLQLWPHLELDLLSVWLPFELLSEHKFPTRYPLFLQRNSLSQVAEFFTCVH